MALKSLQEHAFELDRKNGNNLWKDALETEMYNIGVAFEILEDGKLHLLDTPRYQVT